MNDGKLPPEYLSNPSHVSPVTRSHWSISPASRCRTTLIVTLLGRRRGQGERSSSPILRLHWRIRKNGILPWSHPLPVPCPSRKAGNRSPLWLPVSHLCAAARSTRAHSSARFKSPGTASGAAGTKLIILIGLWGSPVFSHIMSLYNLNQD